MNDVIRLLPDSVANQIAAGEVIQRPASVVKELVENAVDAGATDIQIIIVDAGRTLIQVVDNGRGMSETDARMAFERHATSKIEQAADLFSLRTMGFRGEALASIAAVAQVDLRTMPHGEQVGTRIQISGSHVESQQPEACAPGCNMMVKNLFFNVPARRKFLKKDAVELSNIMREFERLALVNPDIDFTLMSNGAVVHKLMHSSLKQRITDLFGRGLDKQLLPVSTSTSIVRLEGFVCRPEYARRRNVLQYLFVNGRHMRHPYFHKAVISCYEQMLPADMQPNYFLNFYVEPDSIDVNIHPTKSEIKFENESAIWQILTAAIKESMGRFGAAPAIDFDAVDAPGIPVFNPDMDATHEIELDTSYNPFGMENMEDVQMPQMPSSAAVESKMSSAGSVGHQRQSSLQDWDKLYESFSSERSDEGVELTKGSAMNELFADELSVEEPSGIVSGLVGKAETPSSDDVGSIQLKNRYILSPSKSGVMVVDQHRAHVKVLYERYLAMLESGSAAGCGQKVMFPEVLRLSASQSAIFSDIEGELSRSGYELTFLGDNSWSINSVPSCVDASANAVEMLHRIIENVSEHGSDARADLRSLVAESMASAAAIPAGKVLTAGEREHLLSELFQLPSPKYTPDGKLVVSIISIEQIAQLF